MLGIESPIGTPINVRIPSLPTPTIPATQNDTSLYSTPLPEGWWDAREVMRGICFEAMVQQRDQTLVMRSAEEHIAYYDSIDNSGWCDYTITRHPFDFEQGAILVGLWSYGRGCDALHTLENVARDDTAQTLNITLNFSTSGACGYELIRPFWVGMDADMSDYAIQIDVLGDG
jgi:hypothetical protein